MSEIQIKESYEQKVLRLSKVAKEFLQIWAESHTQMDHIGTIPFDPDEYPFQAINRFKTPGIASRMDIEPHKYVEMLRKILATSFEDPGQIEPFLNSFTQEYPYPEGAGRDYMDVLTQDYLDKGVSVAAVLGHPEDRLTDSPRFGVALAINLYQKYDMKYTKNTGIVVGAPLKLETYRGHPVAEFLSLIDLYWTLTKSDNTELYRLKAQITEEELRELSEFMNSGFGRTLMYDAQTKKEQDDGTIELGRIIAFNPTASRAKITYEANGSPSSIVFPGVQLNTGRLMEPFGGHWPIAIVGDGIKIGRIVTTDHPPKGLDKNGRHLYSLAKVEDSMEAVAGLINELLQGDIARYTRDSPPTTALIASRVGESALKAAITNA